MRSRERTIHDHWKPRSKCHGLSKPLAALLGVTLLVGPAAAESPAIKAMQDYMEFAPYEAGIIVPQQLSKEIFDSVVLIDTRDAAQFAAGSIPGARNIEWREVLSRIDEIPKSGCDAVTGPAAAEDNPVWEMPHMRRWGV